jgi:NodT family efflux transporter outer membrane factor (OMF) lipoprotein
VLLGLSGCAVGPDFATPTAQVADSWLEWRGKVLKSDETGHPNWWRAFRDPTLDHLIDIASRQNLTLLSAGTRVLQARAELGIAAGELFPQQQQGAGNTIYNVASHATPTSTSSVAPRRFWTDAVGFQAAWELDFWGKFRRGVESADAVYLASIASYDDVLVTLLADVASTYVGIRTLQAQIRIAQENIVRQRESVRIARARFAEKVTSQLDVFQAENVLGATEAVIPQLTIQLKQGLNALRVLLGMAPEPLDKLLARSKGIPRAPASVSVGIPADLLRRRPDIRAAELKAAAQSAQVGVAAAELYPAISITGSFGGSASNVGGHNLLQALHPIGRAAAIGPSFQWNILNYGQITNNVRFQDAKLQQYLTDYQNAVLKAQQDVENGIALYSLSRSQASLLQRSATAAQGALKIALLEYQQGTRDFTTVLTAEQNLYTAENNLATATGNISLGAVSLYRALGGGWQIREGRGFVDPATVAQMRARTNWGDVLPPTGEPQPPAPGLPGPEDRGPTVRAPDW